MGSFAKGAVDVVREERNTQGRHDESAAKVEATLEAKKQLAAAQTDRDETYDENKCASLDRQMDRLVYDLYGLTEEEIGIVEGAVK